MSVEKVLSDAKSYFGWTSDTTKRIERASTTLAGAEIALRALERRKVRPEALYRRLTELRLIELRLAEIEGGDR